MSPPSSCLFQVKAIPSAGRGVIATQNIPQGTEILRSDPPAAHVIFRQYRKEVCARCFYYDRGRTLPVRDVSTGRFFCSAACQSHWLDEEGELGPKAWENLHAFVQARTKDVASGHETLPGRGGKPLREAIEVAWARAETTRVSRHAKGGKKSGSGNAKSIIDPDILGYLLSSIFSHHRSPESWIDSVLELAMDDTPYRSTQELAAHIDAFLHLSTLLPAPLLSSCTPEICHQAVAAAGHNSFGIRDEDGEEYMGYALYPSASYFNHACDANVSKRRVGREWVFTAQRDISAGEECCITYLGGDEDDLTVLERRGRTKEHWGFECMCARCREESS